MTEAIDPRLLPLGHVGFERTARLCREASHLKPLAFEVLLHTPLAFLLAGSAVSGKATGRMDLTPLLVSAVADEGIAAFSHAVFSDIEHFRLFTPGRDHHCRTFSDGGSLIAQLLEESSGPLVADPRTSHAVCFGYEEMCDWMTLWANTPPAADPYTKGDCAFIVALNYSQVLLDRIAAFFVGFERVERAYLMWVRWPDFPDVFRLVLMIHALDQAVFERIRRALPLLCLDLHPDQAPQYVMSLNDHPSLKRDVTTYVHPVYDRAIAPWLAPVRPDRP